MSSQLNLPHGTKQKKNNEETKNKERRCSEETVQSWSPWSQFWGWKGVYGGKDVWKSERGRSWGRTVGVKERGTGSYGWWEWWAERARRSGRSMNSWKLLYVDIISSFSSLYWQCSRRRGNRPLTNSIHWGHSADIVVYSPTFVDWSAGSALHGAAVAKSRDRRDLNVNSAAQPRSADRQPPTIPHSHNRQSTATRST